MSRKRYPVRSGFGERPFRGVDIDLANDSNGSEADPSRGVV